MESKQAEKSRKEKRKDARSEKHQSRHLSWIEHQKVSKLKRNAAKSKQKPKTGNNNTTKASGKELLEKKREVSNVIEKDEKDVAEEKSSKKLKAALPLDSTETLRKKEKKSLKRKSKSKFDEYLEMEMNKGTVTAEEDLAWERKLAKKLKVNSGKLRGTDDGINTLFNGIASVLDYSVDERDETEFKISSKTTKRKKRKVVVVAKKEEEENEDELEGGLAAEESEQVESGAAEVTREEPPVKKPALAKTVKYMPPHLRSRGENESQEHIQIRRQVRGLLNRLSESNLESITAEISTIYRSIGRIAGSQIISEEVLASCTGGPRGNKQYAAVFAAFVAGMACVVGIDFSAKVIASLARSFEDEYSKEDNLSLRNLTLLLSYLCIFGVSSSDLIYDFLTVLSKRLTEIDVSTILTILQCCGMKLRSDDPTAMKDFILNVQSRVNELKSSFGSVAGNRQNINNKRMEFMLETICEIKNNKKRSKEDPSQHTRIKKWLQKLRVVDVLLRGLKWSKLLDPDKKGQWWISGDVASATDDVKEVACTIDREVLEAQKLLQLAAAQRMNTDARRAIFCIIMSGEDYVDAFEKLLRLDLPGKQDRELVRVLVECCLQEKVFNKYYTVLASKLCSHDKNHKFTLQFCLWDHFKELESMELIRSMNLARFIAEMLVSFSLSLAALKTVELSDPLQLTAKRIIHFRMLFEAIFEQPDAIVWNIFTRVAVIPELETLREGLEFFIKQYVVKTNKKMSAKFKVAKKALNNTVGVLM